MKKFNGHLGKNSLAIPKKKTKSLPVQTAGKTRLISKSIVHLPNTQQLINLNPHPDDHDNLIHLVPHPLRDSYITHLFAKSCALLSPDTMS